MITLVAAAQEAIDDFGLIQIPKRSSSSASNDEIISTNWTSWRAPESHRNVYLLRTSSPDFSILLPTQATDSDNNNNHTSSLLRKQHQSNSNNNNNNNTLLYRLEKPSQQAQHYNCDWASNGGPYNPNGQPVGTIIRNHGRDVIGSFDNNAHGDVGFGHTNTHWILGRLTQEKSVSLDVQDFVTSMVPGWLVYQSRNVVSSLATERAPRTAIGVDGLGNLILLVADGAEHWLWGQGLTLYELADILVAHNVTYAMNLDGGGSSVLTRRGRQQQQPYTIVSRPTCLDVPLLVCERAVSTVICLRHTTNTKHSKDNDDDDDSALWFPNSGGVPVSDRFLFSTVYHAHDTDDQERGRDDYE
jgi:uncharacterized protein YigE (DUF2233 family)